MNSNPKRPSFAIQSTNSFAKQLSKLPKEVESSVFALFSEIELSGQLPKSKPLVGRLKGLHSTRILVVYRLLFEADLENRIFYAVSVGHRKDVYR